MKKRILVIRLGALGDLVLCFKAFQSIRDAYLDAEIALLTMPIYAEFARKMPWFDRVITDRRLPLWRVDAWADLLSRIWKFSPSRVYDLQGKLRQNVLYWLLGGPFVREWSGAAPFCSHPRQWPPLPGMHFTDFMSTQLERAGIAITKDINLAWLEEPIDQFSIPEKFVLLIPGCARGREYKRWPAEKYADLATRLYEKGISSVVIGTDADSSTIDEICGIDKNAVNLCGKTSLFQIAALAKKAEFVVGNDTGPTHIAAAVGAKTLAIMSERVNPLWSAPKGAKSAWIQGNPVSALSVEKVEEKLNDFL